MRALNLGIDMDQGADFSLVIGIDGLGGAVDLTGYSFLGEMRSMTNDADPVAEFDFIILDQATNRGRIKWSLPAAEIDAIVLSTANSLEQQRLTTPFMFDIKMKDTANQITRIIEGIIYVSPQVTDEDFS